MKKSTMVVFYFALHLTGITLVTGILSFSSKPKPEVYHQVGSEEVVLNWEYDETDEVQFTDWRVFNDTEGRYRYIRVENENGTSLFNPLVPWVPAAFLERIKRKGRATIIIKNITFEYSALFRCTLSGKTGVASIDDTISLVVTGLCNVNPPVQIRGDGDYPRFTCGATDVPGKNFTWKRQGQQEKILITNDTKYTVISIRGSSQLTVKDVDDGNQGYYFCETDADINQPCSDTVFLQLKKFRSSCSKKDYSSSIGKNLTIECPLSGYPPPIVTWKKNGILLQKGENTKLTITSVNEDDFGIYTCTATNFETSAGPCNITVVKEIVDLPVKCSHGTAEKPAKLEWSPLVGAKYYVVEMAGDDVRGDRNVFTGATTSLEIHYLTLVMKADKKPETTQMRVSLSAMGDESVLAQGACEKLTLKRPSDVEV